MPWFSFTPSFFYLSLIMNNMDQMSKFPFYAKIILIFIGACFFFFVLYAGQQIILPILYASIISVLLNPIVNVLISRKLNRILAIATAVFIALVFTLGLVYLISSQLKMFQATFP